MAITAQMVKELREKTGAGMMDCKKALTKVDGDMDAAITFLREKGLAAAAKKAGRVAAEGLIAAFAKDNVAALVEVNCETDFVAKNDEFKTLVSDLAEQIVGFGANDVDALNGQKFFKDDSKTVAELVTAKISTIGENISVRRFARLDTGSAYGTYIHGGGTIGVVVELKLEDASKAGEAAVQTLAKDLAMHVAAASPEFLKRDQADEKAIEAEKAIYRQQALDSGKPEKIVDNIVNGRINKWFAQVCLTEQAFVKDPDVKVSKLVENIGKEVGTGIELASYTRYKVGDGIEKKADDFAAEVAKMTGQG